MRKEKNKTLVLGASTTKSRYSNVAVKRLLENNFEVEAIGKKNGFVYGVKINQDKKEDDTIDTVTIYLNPSNQEEFYDYVVNLKPRRVIFNPGAENKEFETILDSNNIAFERSCTLVLLSINEY